MTISRRFFLGQLTASLLLPTLVNTPVLAKLKPATYHGWWKHLKTGQKRATPCAKNVLHPIGSVFKLITLLAMVDDQPAVLNKQWECRGQWVARSGERVRCYASHGRLTVVEAVGFSCNVVVAQAAQALPHAKLARMANAFGLSIPRMPNQLWVNSVVLGEGVCARPQQVLGLAEAIALQQGELSHQSWEAARAAMHHCARYGTGKAFDKNHVVNAALKTGTVEHGRQFESWVTGFYPILKPEWVFVVYAPAGTSRQAAVPHAKRWLEAHPDLLPSGVSS